MFAALALISILQVTSPCDINPPQAFTLQILNKRPEPVTLNIGCGRFLPITFRTQHGDQLAGPGDGTPMTCEHDLMCEQVYAGQWTEICSDCGAGVYRTLVPGEQVAVNWDRRTYTTVTPACNAGPAQAQGCYLGVSLLPQSQQKGHIAYCPGQIYCKTSETVTQSFTINTSHHAAVIEINN